MADHLFRGTVHCGAGPIMLDHACTANTRSGGRTIRQDIGTQSGAHAQPNDNGFPRDTFCHNVLPQK